MTTTNLNDLAKQIHENAKAKGFWDETRNTGEIFMLIVSELAEALEADRKGKWADMKKFAVGHDGSITDEQWFQLAFQSSIKDTFEDELADAVIRIMDYCAFSGTYIDIVEYEQQGDFDVKKGCNIGKELMDINSMICRAFYEIDGNNGREMCLNAALIILFNLADVQGFDIMQHIELKMKYNATREHKHGKAY